MSDNASPSSDTTQLSSPQPTATRLTASPSHFTQSSAARTRRILPLLSVGALAGALLLVIWLLFDPASPVYALITPPHTPDFIEIGQSPIQQFGFSVASAGDINKDGYGDVIVGANNLNNAIYVYTGSIAGLTNTVYFSATGFAGENFGHSVAGGGDVNDDGVDDFIVGAPFSSSSKGAVYVYFGAAIGLPTRGATLTGELDADNFGWSVAIIGDVNHDGIDDVAVGASEQGVSDTGRVYIYHGPVVGNAVTPDTTLDGEAPLDNFGVSVAGAGDVNGDGIDDLIVGAAKNGDGGIEAGKAYVYYGSGSGVSQGNFTAVIGNANDKLGTSVHGAGDVNGDGFADVIIGADATNPGEPSPGYFAIYPGGPLGLITSTYFAQIGEGVNDRYGFAVTGKGDLDGDGFSDFAVGAYEADVNPTISTTDEGQVYGFVACTNGAISPSRIFSDTGEASLDAYGRSLAIVQDVNGDNIDDLVVGAYAAKNSVPVPVGKVYAYYGVAGGCQPALVVTKTVGLADFPAIYTDTSVITVPLDAAVAYTYTVRNTGNVTLTQQRVVDDKLGIVTQVAYTLPPGANLSTSITGIAGISATPGVSITNVATWTGALSITSPSGVTTPTNRVLSASAVASAQVNISGPTTDQDGDTIPDNLETSDDFDQDGLPNYLDTDSDDDGRDDAEEVGPDPNNPVDRDGDNQPSYLDPDENPDTTTEVAVGGLSIAAPAKSLQGQPVNFTAVITAGTNVSYTWDFGDGDVATSLSSDAANTAPDANHQAGIDQTITHTYTDPGFYIVTVTATNSVNEKQATKSIIVQFGIFMPRIMTICIFQE